MYIDFLMFFFYISQSCDAMLDDRDTQDLLRRQFDLLIIDGAFPECALAMAHRLNVPFMYINTVGFYTGSLSLAGNPSVYSVSPAFYSSFTDEMTLMQRTVNTILHVFANFMHSVSTCTRDGNNKILRNLIL